MKEIKIGNTLWHPCSLDIIEHKVISIRQFDGFNHYVCKAVHNVGACGRVEVILDQRKNKLMFVELLDEDRLEYASGLQDFVEGNYYTTLEEAKIEYYSMFLKEWRWDLERKKRDYEERKMDVEKYEKILKELKESLLNQKR